MQEKPTITQIFKAKRKGFIYYLLVAALIPLGIYTFGSNRLNENSYTLIPILIPFLLLLWAYLTTRYQIKNKELHYRSAFLFGKLDIESINSITVGKTLWSGTKPALARKGIIIKYNRYDEIYIAPQRNNEMIAAILKLNPTIEVIYADKAG